MTQSISSPFPSTPPLILLNPPKEETEPLLLLTPTVDQPEVESAPHFLSTPTKLETASKAPDFISPACVRTKELFKRVVLSSPIALEKAQRVRDIQKDLTEKGADKEACELPITPTNHCYVTEKKLFLTEKKAGKGADSEAWFSDELDPSTSDEPRGVVLKRSACGQIKHENFLAQKITLSSPSKRKKLNIVEEAFQISSENVYIGIYEACQSDLNGLIYSSIAPASQILPILRDIAEGLFEINKQRIVHRDIKGANLLVTREGGGSIGDFGFARKVLNRRHSTSMTPRYAAPFIWGNIVDQKFRRNGYQAEPSDVFAFGVTLQFDVLKEMLLQLGAHYNIKDIPNRIKAIEPYYKPIGPEWTDQDLLNEEIKNRKHFQRIMWSPDHLSAYIKIEIVLNIVLESIDLFQGHISPQELAKMRGLAHLMHDLQDRNPRNLSAAKVLKGLQALIDLAEEAPKAASSSSSASFGASSF